LLAEGRDAFEAMLGDAEDAEAKRDTENEDA
jgi:hypothetical protein